MLIAHLSDTHLGFRAYARTTPQGFNQREHDVTSTFKACLAAIGEREPDLVVHSGDLFHMVRPSNVTIVETYQALSAFQQARGGRPFVIIGGNHDTPRASEMGNILNLFRGIPGIDVAPVETTSFDYPELDAEVLCVPNQSLKREARTDWLPRLGRRHAVLTVHGMATQTLLPGEADFDIEQTRKGAWSYVALGDYHKYQAFGANVCYAGSTDFTSSNIWEEAGAPKGWTLYDCARGSMEFQPVKTRAVLDLPQIDGEGLTADELSAKLVQQARWEAEQPIVRQVVRNVMPEVRAKISLEALRSIQSRALDYRFQTLSPALSSAGLSPGGYARPLESCWLEHVAAATLTPGVDRDEVRRLGVELLEEVKDREAAPVEA